MSAGILSQLNPMCPTTTHHVFRINFSITHNHPTLSKLSMLHRFPEHHFVHTSHFSKRATCPASLMFLALTIRIISGEECIIMTLIIMQLSAYTCHTCSLRSNHSAQRFLSVATHTQGIARLIR